MKNENTLIMMIGLPRSGKSSFCREFLMDKYPIVNPDSIRLSLCGKRFLREVENQVWKIAKIMVNSLFIYGHEKVVLDATNVTKQRRDFWINEELYKIEYILIDTKAEECVKRALQENDFEIIEIINKMNLIFEKPNFSDFSYIKPLSDHYKAIKLKK